MTTPSPEVLIVVESRHGSTLGIAGAIAQRLVSRGLRARVSDPHDCSDVDADATVVGSAVYLGKWLKPALAFLDDHAAALAARPLWLFSSGPLGDGPTTDDGLAETYIADLVERSHARAHRVFAGRLDTASLGPIESLVAHAVHAPAGDFRDWTEIREWADEIAAAVTAGHAHPTDP
jgi:menaquinone-dependent protoporphyrinogen oxidase